MATSKRLAPETPPVAATAPAPAAVPPRARGASGSAAAGEADTRRSTLVNEAARLFGTRGYASTSMREIAAAFGILPGSLYHHFRSKDELFITVYAAGVAHIQQRVEKAVARQQDPWLRLEAACVAHLQTLLVKESYAAAVITDWSATTLVMQAQLVPLRDQYEQVFEQLIAALPLPPEADRHTLKLALLGALNWSLTWYRPGRESPAAVARKLLQAFRLNSA